MELREKAQTRSYDEITKDVEKYLLAAIDSLNDKRPTSIECNSVAFGGNEDCSHVHIIVDTESKVVIDVEGDKIKVTLEDTGESVILNEKDTQDVHDLIIVKLQETVKERKSRDKHGILAYLLVLPMVIEELEKAGKGLADLTPSDIQELLDKKIDEMKEHN